MRFLFIGNVNNEPYRLAYELTRLGHSATVVTTRASALDDPEQLHALKYFQPSNVNVFRGLEATPFWEWVAPGNRTLDLVASLANDSDLVVTNDVGHSLSGWLRRPSWAFISGSDLLSMASGDFAESLPIRNPRLHLRAARDATTARKQLVSFSKRQAKGIVDAQAHINFPKGASTAVDQALNDLGILECERYPWRGCTPSGLVPKPQRELPLRVLVGSRLSERHAAGPWSSSLDDKGTYTVILGWAKALEAGLQGQLRLFDKGPGASEARYLIDELGIAKTVTWLPEANLMGFLQEIYAGDVVIDSLGEAPPGRVSIEAIAARRGLITRGNASELESRFGCLPLTLRAPSSESGLADALLGFQQNHATGDFVGDDWPGVAHLIDPRTSAANIASGASRLAN